VPAFRQFSPSALSVRVVDGRSKQCSRDEAAFLDLEQKINNIGRPCIRALGSTWTSLEMIVMACLYCFHPQNVERLKCLHFLGTGGRARHLA